MKTIEAAAEHGFSAAEVERLSLWLRRYPHPQMGLIEALREVQDMKGSITVEAEKLLAGMFEMPPKAVREVATFYPYFTQAKAGKRRVALCRNLSCTLGGADELRHALEHELGIKEGETTADGEFSLEEAECLGLCELAPALTVNDECPGRLKPADAKAFVARMKKETPGPLPMPAPVYVHGPIDGGEDKRLLTRHFNESDCHTLAGYKRHGGYESLAKALKLTPAQIQDEVKTANLRGLGGAGFPVAMKWSTVPPKEKVNKPHYLVINADESEPGCYKDRVLMERGPHQLIEGILIAAYAVAADHIFIFIRGEYAQQARVLENALREAREAGLLGKGILGSAFDADIHIMRGANAYISGCDSALLETMEGKKAWPRQAPPFPTVAGVMASPTVVNNVETVSMLPHIFRLGGAGFAALGAPKSGGTVVLSVSGHVVRPGIYEVPMGTPLTKVLEAAGGVPGGKAVKAVIPGGTSTPMLTPADLDVALDFDSVRAKGSFLGAGGLIVLDETVDMVETLHIIERFLWHESCGQCTPCREGSGWITRILKRVIDGGGVPEDLDNIQRVSENITGKVICALGDTVGMVGTSTLKKFRPDFEKRIQGARP